MPVMLIGIHVNTVRKHIKDYTKGGIAWHHLDVSAGRFPELD
jgi:pentose-5-phosphate-3-epimerase